MAASDDLDTLWDHLLSRDMARIQVVFAALTPAQQAAVLSHLQRMATETGWHVEQARSAQIALQALGEKNTWISKS
jgi:hypothetical protein